MLARFVCPGPPYFWGFPSPPPGRSMLGMTQTEDTAAGRIGSFPPDEASKAASRAVPGTRVTPGVVSALDGPVVAGPEQAGALSLLHTTFACSESAQRAYRNF